MTTQQQQKQKRQGNSLSLSPSLHRNSKSLRSAASTTCLNSNMSLSLSPPTSVMHDELHALVDNINCSIDDDVVVGPIYGLLKDDAEEQQECDNSDNSNNSDKNKNNNSVAFSRRKSKYGDRVKSVDALFVDMYVLNAANGLLEYNSDWRQKWDASVTARRAERAARARRGGRRRVSPLPAAFSDVASTTRGSSRTRYSTAA